MAPQPRLQLVSPPNFTLSAPVSSKTIPSDGGAQTIAPLRDCILAENLRIISLVGTSLGD